VWGEGREGPKALTQGGPGLRVGPRREKKGSERTVAEASEQKADRKRGLGGEGYEKIGERVIGEIGSFSRTESAGEAGDGGGTG